MSRDDHIGHPFLPPPWLTGQSEPLPPTSGYFHRMPTTWFSTDSISSPFHHGSRLLSLEPNAHNRRHSDIGHSQRGIPYLPNNASASFIASMQTFSLQARPQQSPAQPFPPTPVYEGHSFHQGSPAVVQQTRGSLNTASQGSQNKRKRGKGTHPETAKSIAHKDREKDRRDRIRGSTEELHERLEPEDYALLEARGVDQGRDKRRPEKINKEQVYECMVIRSDRLVGIVKGHKKDNTRLIGENETLRGRQLEAYEECGRLIESSEGRDYIIISVSKLMRIRDMIAPTTTTYNMETENSGNNERDHSASVAPSTPLTPPTLSSSTSVVEDSSDSYSLDATSERKSPVFSDFETS
ncbi:MAG: hypothetical protein M1834_006603 [Cirrosporium novae-zelandiae]|nr:MAG: hypothetical protein M1834_006603 [Cirrosporium novae-zelandiae]